MLIVVQILFFLFLSSFFPVLLFLPFSLVRCFYLFAMQLLFVCMYIPMHYDYVLCTRLEIKWCSVLFCLMNCFNSTGNSLNKTDSLSRDIDVVVVVVMGTTYLNTSLLFTVMVDKFNLL